MPRSLDVLWVCAAAALSLLLLIPAVPRNDGEPARAQLKQAQRLSLAMNILASATGTLIITDSGPLMSSLGSSTFASGMLMGCTWLLMFVGAFAARYYLLGLPQELQRRVSTGAFIALAFCCGLYGLSASPPSWFARSYFWRTLGLFVSRLLFGLALGIPLFMLEMLVFRVTPRAEQVHFNVTLTCAKVGGSGLGPVFSSLVSVVLGAEGHVGQHAAGPQLIFCVLWLCTALLSVAWLPRTLDALLKHKREQDAAEELAGKAVHSAGVRRDVYLKGVLYGLERAFLVSACEAATAVILETEFGLTDDQSGFAVGTVFVAGLPLMLLVDRLCKEGYLSEPVTLLVAAVACSVAAFFILPGTSRLLGIPAAQGKWVLLAADFVIFSTAYLNSGISDGLVVKNANEKSVCNLSNFVLYCRGVLHCCVGRLVGPTVARGLLSSGGRLGYGLFQSVLSMVALCTITSLVFSAFAAPPSAAKAAAQTSGSEESSGGSCPRKAAEIGSPLMKRFG